MPVDPKFRKRLGREIRLFIQETRDGCPNCMESPTGVCGRHDDLWAMGVIVNPRKYLKLDPGGRCERVEPA